MEEAGKKGGRGREPLDLAHLATQTMGDRVLAREVLELFLVHSAAMLARIKAPQANPQEQREAAHALVGAARGIGAFGVADAARAVEHAVADMDIARLESEVERAGRFISGHLALG